MRTAEHGDGQGRRAPPASVVSRLLTTGQDCQASQVQGDWVVWQAFDGHDAEIYFTDEHGRAPCSVARARRTGPHHQQSPDDAWATIGGGVVVFRDGEYDIRWYEVETGGRGVVYRDAVRDEQADTDGRSIVWVRWDGDDYEVFHMDIASRLITQLSDNDVADAYPVVHGNRVAWQTWVGSNWDIVVKEKTDGRWATVRGQFAEMIAGALSLPASEASWNDGDPHFIDLGPDDPGSLYPHDYVAAVADADITRGTTPTHGLNMKVAELLGLLDGIEGFDRSWNPWAPATRAECAKVIWAMRELLE